jgi:GDP-L-fucose synthase
MDLDSKIYVAGHRGLVGSAIVNNLKRKGYTNLVTRTHAELDLTNQCAVADFFAAEKPEYVFLAAAKVGGIVANNTYRAEFIYENLQIQNNVIHQCYLNSVKKLLFLGSTCIYPKECPQPMKEEYLLTSPLEYTNEPYAVAKIAGIKMCESYNLQYGTNFISAMPTNLYGPNDNFDLEKSHVLPALIRKMHLGKCLEVNDWEAIRNDLNQRPIEDIDGTASQDEILAVLQKYGLRITNQKVNFAEREAPLGDVLQVTPYESRLTDHESRPAVQVEIWGTGKPMREFLWSEDMADACVYLMERIDFEDVIRNSLNVKRNEEGSANELRDAKFCKAVTEHDSEGEFRRKRSSPGGRITIHEIRNTHINIGTGFEISIEELSEMIREIVGFNGQLLFNANKPDGSMRKVTDTTRLSDLGWSPAMELADGIKSLYEWYK